MSAVRHVVPLLALGLVAGVALVSGLGRPGDDGAVTASASVASSPPTATSSASPARPAGRVGVRPERPASVRLPSGAEVPVVAVGTRTDGVLDVPDDIRSSGWWRGGARIGDPFGSTLVAAHVDSRTQGLGPYAELLGVQPGARVVVTSAHLRQVFRVSSLRLLPRTQLARATDIFAASGRRRLTLVTCAGPYDPDRGGYVNVAIVTALPTHAPRPRRTP